jgi:ribose-phosphate pyrophosphokinase
MHLVSPNFSDLFLPNLEIGKFPDGDSHVRIPDLKKISGSDVVLFHRLYPNQNDGLVELLLILDALKYENAKSITVVSPYFPYARQDKQTLDGEIASAHVVSNILARAGCSKMVTIDCHFLNSEGEFMHGELKMQNLSLGREIIEHAKNYFKGQSFEIVGPDAGAAYLVAEAGGMAMKKVRKAYEQNKIAYRNIETLDGKLEVKGKNVLLIDDMISTGTTMITALEKVSAAGASSICCGTIHGLFLYNCLDKIRKFTDCVFATNTIASAQAEVSIKDRLMSLFSNDATLF